MERYETSEKQQECSFCNSEENVKEVEVCEYCISKKDNQITDLDFFSVYDMIQNKREELLQRANQLKEVQNITAVMGRVSGIDELLRDIDNAFIEIMGYEPKEHIKF